MWCPSKGKNELRAISIQGKHNKKGEKLWKIIIVNN